MGDMKKVKSILSAFFEVPFSFFSLPEMNKKFFFVFGCYLLALSSLFLADYFHTGDDFVRAWNAIRRWSGGGRHLNDYIGYAMNFSYYHRDITPIVNILALTFLTSATLILTYTITGALTYRALLGGLALGLSPYFLQNLSYKFDCAFFCLSLLWSTLPFLWFNKGRLFYGALGICTFLICCTYQATLSILGMTFLYLLFQEYIHGAKIKTLLIKAGITAIIVITVVLGYTYIERQINTNLYTLNRSVLCLMAENVTCSEVVIRNLTTIWIDFFKDPWQGTPMATLAYLFLGFCLIAFLFKALLGISRPRRIIAFCVAPAIFIGMITCIFIWTIFFTEIVQSPRIFVGVGGVLAIGLMTFLTLDFSQFPIFGKGMTFLYHVLSYIILWALVVFALRYGNLLFIQWEYDRYKLSRIEHELGKLPYGDILFKASPRAPAVLRRYEEYPFYRKLVLAPPLYYTNFYFGPSYSKCRIKSNKAKSKEIIYQDNEFSLTLLNDYCVLIDAKQ